jgi:hypothetical protein
VQSDMVGAIIGRQGSTIRQITQQTRARLVRKPVISTVCHSLGLCGLLCYSTTLRPSQQSYISFR